jgi:major membrane immunogen (membrane-anchored lipoprotein)
MGSMRSVRHILLFVVAVLASALLASCGDSNDSESANPQPTGPLPSKGDLLFIVRGPTDVSDGRLAVETDVVEWFTDRPTRRAGAARVDELAADWQSFGFAQDPPNAAVSGTKDFVTVELSDPQIQGGQISFAYHVIKGKLASGDNGFWSLFVDAGAHKDNPTQVPLGKDNPQQVPLGKDNPQQVPLGKDNPEQIPVG